MKWKKIKHFVGLLFSLWFLLTFFSFVTGFVISGLGSPQSFELPWSDVKDYVQTSKGKVFISLEFYRKVLSYDENGTFLATYGFPYGKNAHLAVDETDRLFYWAGERVVIYDENWNEIGHVEKPSPDCNCISWSLGNDGIPVCNMDSVPTQMNSSDVVRIGETLLSSEIRNRKIFRNLDGTKVIRGWFSLTRFTRNDQILAEYHSPWYLDWAVFPFPGLLAWGSAMILGLWKILKRKWDIRHGITAST
jgi:hypothetical protein